MWAWPSARPMKNYYSYGLSDVVSFSKYVYIISLFDIKSQDIYFFWLYVIFDLFIL